MVSIHIYIAVSQNSKEKTKALSVGETPNQMALSEHKRPYPKFDREKHHCSWLKVFFGVYKYIPRSHTLDSFPNVMGCHVGLRILIDCVWAPTGFRERKLPQQVAHPIYHCSTLQPLSIIITRRPSFLVVTSAICWFFVDWTPTVIGSSIYPNLFSIAMFQYQRVDVLDHQHSELSCLTNKNGVRQVN